MTLRERLAALAGIIMALVFVVVGRPDIAAGICFGSAATLFISGIEDSP